MRRWRICEVLLHVLQEVEVVTSKICEQGRRNRGVRGVWHVTPSLDFDNILSLDDPYLGKKYSFKRPSISLGPLHIFGTSAGTE